MSYYLKMQFAQAESCNAVWDLCQKLKKEMFAHRLEIIDEQLSYPERCNILLQSNKDLYGNWVKSNMSMQILYWKNLQLFAVMSAYDFQDLKTVEFQDLNNQDYDYATYPADISFFAKTVNEAKNSTLKLLRRISQTTEEDGVDENYERRLYCYKKIEHDLGLKDYINCSVSDNPPFEKLEICTLDDSQEYTLMTMYVKQKLAES